MTSRFRYWLTVLALAAVVATSASWVRTRLHSWSHDRALDELTARLAALPDRQAVRLVRRLASADDEWLAVLVPAMADARPALATAAASSIEQLVDRWSSLPTAESRPRVEMLAALLARHASRLPAERVARAQSLAQRLIDWPANGHSARAAQLIADCEVVLRLVPADSAEEATTATDDRGRSRARR